MKFHKYQKEYLSYFLFFCSRARKITTSISGWSFDCLNVVSCFTMVTVTHPPHVHVYAPLLSG